jgi:hypothetical protein
MFLYGREVELMVRHFGADVENETTDVASEDTEDSAE